GSDAGTGEPLLARLAAQDRVADEDDRDREGEAGQEDVFDATLVVADGHGHQDHRDDPARDTERPAGFATPTPGGGRNLGGVHMGEGAAVAMGGFEFRGGHDRSSAGGSSTC